MPVSFFVRGYKNVTEIAMECGFNNISNFYRLYKKHVGKTPKDENRRKVKIVKNKKQISHRRKTARC